MQSKTTVLAIAVGILLPMLAQGKVQLTNYTEVTPELRFALVKSGTAAGHQSQTMPTNVFASTDEIVYVVSPARNQAVTFALVPRERPFLFSLRDGAGKTVPKTAMGLAKSSPADTSKVARSLNLRFHPLGPDGAYYNSLLTPEDCFILTNKGPYTLEVQVRLWAKGTNQQYGIVVSDPVRVKVVKQ